MYETRSVVRPKRDGSAAFDATQRSGLVPRSLPSRAPFRLVARRWRTGPNARNSVSCKSEASEVWAL